jgi:addiction module HigA family antidote
MSDSTDLSILHPGEVLYEEFMFPLGLTVNELAEVCHLSPEYVERMVNRDDIITPHTAIKFGLYFKMTPQFWLSLQYAYNKQVAGVS